MIFLLAITVPHQLAFYLIYMSKVKNYMERHRISFIVFPTVLALVIQLLIINSVIAQVQNTSLVQNNNTLKIVDTENLTISIIDPKTNQIVSVMNFTPEAFANMTTNDTLTTNALTTTSSEILTPENTTINETLATDTDNATTNVNLTDKFDALQGK